MQDVRPILNERFGLEDGLKNIQQANHFASAGAGKATAVPVDRPKYVVSTCRYRFLESDDDDDDEVLSQL